MGFIIKVNLEKKKEIYNYIIYMYVYTCGRVGTCLYCWEEKEGRMELEKSDYHEKAPILMDVSIFLSLLATTLINDVKESR